MPQISWEVGDFFESARGATSEFRGVVTSTDGMCVVVRGSGGRMGWRIHSERIPNGAVPSNLTGVDFAVRMSLVAITVALGVCPDAQTSKFSEV